MDLLIKLGIVLITLLITRSVIKLVLFFATIILKHKEDKEMFGDLWEMQRQEKRENKKSKFEKFS